MYTERIRGGLFVSAIVGLSACDVSPDGLGELNADELNAEGYWVGTERYDSERVPDESPRYLDEEIGDFELMEEAFDDEVANVVAHTAIQAGASWTQWYDRDNPSGTGDWELRTLQSGVCALPTGVECRTVDGLSLWQTGENVSCSIDGLLCENVQQPDGQCDHDYTVRFLCPEPQQPPSATIVYVQLFGAVCVGPTVGFSAAGSTAGDNPIVSYQWDFDGDGTIDRTTGSSTTTTSYTGPSDEVACVTVVDSAGLSDTACTNLSICMPIP